MSRDSSGESLETILASIRRSLAEQATSMLEDEAATAVAHLPPLDGGSDLDAPPVPASVSQHLATASEARPATAKAVSTGPAGASAPPAGVAPADRALSEVAADRVDPAPVASAAGAPEAAQRDPLWFLSHEPEPIGPADPTAPAKAIVDGLGAPPPPAPESKPERAPDAKPSRIGAVRGPLPPFFGSPAAEVVKVDFVPDPPARRAADAMSPLPPPLPPASYPLDSRRAVNGEPLRSVDGSPRAADNAGSMRASSIFGPPPGDPRTGGAGDVAMSQVQALEVMVAELLRPMLRRWLDENMPRLVSAALKAEAELAAARDPGCDPKKP